MELNLALSTLHPNITMDHGESELYTLKNQFYTNQYLKVIAYPLEQFSSETQLSVLVFQVRATIALGHDASQLIENGKSTFGVEQEQVPKNELVFQLLQAWNDLQTFGTDDSIYFDDIILSGKTPTTELQAVLTALYLVKWGKNVDQAIQVLNRYVDAHASAAVELECYLVLVQLYFVRGTYAPAFKIFNDFKQMPSSVRDSIVYQVLESWVLSIKGESDNISNAYYFYDELLSADFDDDAAGKLRVLGSVFALTLQLKHYPEAQELLTQMKALDGDAQSADFVANQITLDYLTHSGENVPVLLENLAKLDPEHQLLRELLEKNKLFDEVVEKYAVK